MSMTNDRFNEALYYAVREAVNELDKKHDSLIRQAIEHVETCGFPDSPYVTMMSIAALAVAANRRKISAKNAEDRPIFSFPSAAYRHRQSRRW